MVVEPTFDLKSVAAKSGGTADVRSDGMVAVTASSSGVDPGAWLVEHRWEMDRGESAWLEALAVFDRDQGWAADGQLSAVEWLMWHTHMARATAYEKLRIAHQLRRRPLVAGAFADGALSYSAVRSITRIEDPDPDVDAALVDLAGAGSVSDVDRAVRCYQLHRDQHRPPPNPDDGRALRIHRGLDGTGRVEITLGDVEIEELAAVLQAFLDLSSSPDGAVDQSPRGDGLGGAGDESPPADFRPDGAVDESPAGDNCWPARRADAFMDMARTALAHAGDGHAVGADRYLVHVVKHLDHTALLDGTPLEPGTAGQITCDSATVTHLVGDHNEPLSLGRRAREWNTAQRRAITVRDRCRCRFPGCEHRITDIHHRHPWDNGGPTDISNGLLICPRHHRLLHRGFYATGDTNHSVTFHRPDGSILGQSAPPRSYRTPNTFITSSP